MSTSFDTRPPAASDPFELWKQIYEANERAWNGALEQAMATPAFAESQGKLMEALLNGQQTLRHQVRAYQEALNVPTREDIARLGELIIGLEEKIDQLGDRFERIEAAMARARTGAPGEKTPLPAE
jgi:polyhydroxyalkanoic acid synthase PhaR subunit